jgi:hypothetical protein
MKLNIKSLLATMRFPDLTGAGEITTGELKAVTDTIWVLPAGILVFFMNTGFAILESGLDSL